MNPLQIGDLTIPISIVQYGMGIDISLSKLVSAVQFGSHFKATKECDASDEFKHTIIQSHEENIKNY